MWSGSPYPIERLASAFEYQVAALQQTVFQLDYRGVAAIALANHGFK